VCVLHALGIELLIITNAAGGLNPLFQVGDVMVLSDHIDLMFLQTRRAGLAVTAEGTSGGPRRERPQSFYDTALVEQTVEIARQGNFPLQHGVYVGVKGPNYETRAEYRAFRKLGGDVVGMSTIPEVLAAHALGVRVLGLSTVTNIARPDAPQTITPAEVVAMAGRAEPKVRRIVTEVVRGLA
jgi:purine-nucleoside phosphorylase